MVKHEQTAKLLLPVPGKKHDIYVLLQGLEAQAKLASKFDTSKQEMTVTAPAGAAAHGKKPKAAPKKAVKIKEAPKAEKPKTAEEENKDKPKDKDGMALTGDSKPEWANLSPLTQKILETCEKLNKVLKPMMKKAEDEAKAKGLAESKDEKLDLQNWVNLVKEYRFGENKELKKWFFDKEKATHAGEAITRVWMRRLQNEFVDLSKSLPLHPDSSIFMRVKEGDMSMAQVLVTAPPDTPYGRGAFLFDVYFPPAYPNSPPKMNLQTTGNGTFRFNPNLYANGYVCLSLLNTWLSGASQSEKWNPQASTFLQVCVSIQSLIFISQPYFNEPGYESNMNTPHGKEASNNYNSNVRNATVRLAMIDQIDNPPEGFEYVTLLHFYMQKDAILKQVEGWLNDGVSKSSNLSALKSLYTELKEKLEKLKKPEKPAKSADDDD